jgi:hypothetical protein
VVGVRVRLEHARDPQAATLGFREVRLDRVRGVDDDRLARRFVTDQVGRATEVVVHELPKEHFEKTLPTAPASFLEVTLRLDDQPGLVVEPAVEWLLASSEPAIAYLTRRDVLGEEAEADPERILAGPIVRRLLDGQQPDGGFGVHAYKKWGGAHWRLVSLVELAVPPGEPRALAAAEAVLQWLTGAGHRRGLKVIDGLARRCASMEGNALAVCCRLGLAEDPRVALLAQSLVDWQWPDGGWNCDRRASGRRSSFHESLPPAWGLHEYWLATGEEWARDAAGGAAALFLEHRLFRSLRTGDVIDEAWLVPHYPPYWHYDVPQALLVLSRIGSVGDSRADEALEVLMRLQQDDGRWHAGRPWWRAPGKDGTGVEVVDWGRRGPNEMITLNALRVLRCAGRLRL